MKAILPACISATFLMLFCLAKITIGAQKPIEIVHMPRFLFAGADLGFQVRVRGAIDEDRQQWVILCDRTADVCSLEHNERISMVTIEGSAAPKLWSPKPWAHMPPGEYAVVAALGANDTIRVADVLTVSVQGM